MTAGSFLFIFQNLSFQVSFSPDEASNVVKECIEGIIGGVDYSQNKVNQWTASIVEHTLTQLVKQGKPFKYIVNCAVMQKSGAGLHTANSCYWDTTTDGKLQFVQCPNIFGIGFVYRILQDTTKTA
uniref:Dynein light chain Tctex-type 3 n=1 Tax=Sinocyclocheilus grahami TaxID=75366 RepID=A0A672MDA5_SINGR